MFRVALSGTQSVLDKSDIVSCPRVEVAQVRLCS